MLGSTIWSRSAPNPLELTLHNALHYAKSRCVIGSSNRAQDNIFTAGYSLYLYSRMKTGIYLNKDQTPSSHRLRKVRFDVNQNQFIPVSQDWYYVEYAPPQGLLPYDYQKTPLSDPRFNLNPKHKRILELALNALTFQSGNCGYLAMIICKYLWEHAQFIIKIEYVQFEDFDHGFVIVNRMGDLDNPSTWGDAWIIDPWLEDGIVYHVSRFNEFCHQIKSFVSEQLSRLYHFGLEHCKKTDLSGASDKLKVLATILPSIHHYPSYQNPITHPVEHYYYVQSAIPDDPIPSQYFLKYYKTKHQVKFRNVLQQVTEHQPQCKNEGNPFMNKENVVNTNKPKRGCKLS